MTSEGAPHNWWVCVCVCALATFFHQILSISTTQRTSEKTALPLRAKKRRNVFRSLPTHSNMLLLNVQRRSLDEVEILRAWAPLVLSVFCFRHYFLLCVIAVAVAAAAASTLMDSWNAFCDSCANIWSIYVYNVYVYKHVNERKKDTHM